MNLPKLSDLNVSGKRVIVRVDLDVPIENAMPAGRQGEVKEKYRLEAWKPTVDYLLEKGVSKIILIGHLGRPDGKEDPVLSTKQLLPVISEILGQEVAFETEGKIVLKENLRFNSGEEENDPEYAKELASLGDFYVNECFSTSHREHASFVGLPKLLPHAAGLRLVQEVENLTKTLENRKPSSVVLLSGIKKDKVNMIEPLEKVFDKVLVGGRLPEYLGDESLVSVRLRQDGEKVIVANLIQDKEDITLNSIDKFTDEVKKAGTIVLAGVLGRYEDEGHRQGTEKILRAISETSAFKVAGGGDTITALKMFDLLDKFDWVSVGGGAMIEFLTKKTLPGIDALKH